MKNRLRVVMAQLNFTVGDIAGNLQKHREAIQKAQQSNADLIVFPELSMTGYPPEDLLCRKSFIHAANAAVKALIPVAKNLYCIVGHPTYGENGELYNACSVLHDGNIIATYAKQRLPNYAVFDEYRYFTAGKQTCIVPIHDIPIGLLICEDIWSREPARRIAEQNAKLIIVINASPFSINKYQRREKILAQRALETQLPLLYVASVGGQDELIFDGNTMAMDSKGKIVANADLFKETLIHTEIHFDKDKTTVSSPLIAPSIEKQVYEALVLGVRDYILKNNFPGVVIGVSGGIDSALTLAIAVDALGKEKVHAVIMPSRFTSELSLQEAKTITANLGVKTDIVSIEPAYASFLSSLKLNEEGITSQNIQARCRAIMLMALSNQTGFLVLTTGNRSELAVGYCTIYGDMAGGYAPLKDVYKTLVYKLANYRNQMSAIIPPQTILRAPSAELAPNQKDEDTLPPYEILDAILKSYLDLSQNIDEIVAQGFERKMVEKVVRLIQRSEYKRHQAPLGPRIHRKSFGKGWRYPITNGFKSI